MIHLRRWLYLIICCGLCVMLVGCVTATYVETKHYLLAGKTFSKKKIEQNKDTIFVEHMTAVAPFNQLDFLYRVNSTQYLTDYYHGFLVSPTEQLEPILMNYLQASGKFNFDAVGSSMMKNVLRTRIEGIYADYRNRAQPQAVIVLHFILTKLVANERKIILDETVRASVALQDKDTDSLLVAWNKGVQSIMLRSVWLLNHKVNEKSD